MNISKETLVSVVPGVYLCVLTATANDDVEEGIVVVKEGTIGAYTYKQVGTVSSASFMALNSQMPAMTTWTEPETIVTPSLYSATVQFYEFT